MALFVYVLADIIHLLKIVVLSDMFFVFRRRENEHTRLWVVISVFVMSAISLFIYSYDNHLLETFVYIMATILLVYALYAEKIRSVVVITIWMVFALSMIDIMISVLFDICMDLFQINGEFVSNLGVSIISLALVFGVGKIYKKHNNTGMKSIGVFNLVGFTVLLLADTSVVTVIEFASADLNLEKHRNVYLVAVVFVIIGIFIQLASVILLFVQRNVYKEKEQITDKYLNEQKNHYEYLENREKETKKFRHDLRSHMELISKLAKNHAYDEIDSYLEKLHIKIDTFGNLVTVQNGIVDAIINQHYVKALQNGIKMEVRGRFPEKCEIDVYDLCTIFSNVLSNALEAAIETDEKYVSVECRYTDMNVIIVVKNSFNNEQNNEDTWLKSRKENVDYHGFGLENMGDSINKYHGFFDIKTEDNVFILTIMFNNMRKKDYENSDCG